jgi:hypothetical protein
MALGPELNERCFQLDEEVRLGELKIKEREIELKEREFSQGNSWVGRLSKGLVYVLPVFTAALTGLVAYLTANQQTIEASRVADAKQKQEADATRAAQAEHYRQASYIKKEAAYLKVVDSLAKIYASTPGTREWSKGLTDFNQSYWFYLPMYEDREVEAAMVETGYDLGVLSSGGVSDPDSQDFEDSALVLAHAFRHSLDRTLNPAQETLYRPSGTITFSTTGSGKKMFVSIKLDRVPQDGATLVVFEGTQRYFVAVEPKTNIEGIMALPDGKPTSLSAQFITYAEGPKNSLSVKYSGGSD